MPILILHQRILNALIDLLPHQLQRQITPHPGIYSRANISWAKIVLVRERDRALCRPGIHGHREQRIHRPVLQRCPPPILGSAVRPIHPEQCCAIHARVPAKILDEDHNTHAPVVTATPHLRAAHERAEALAMADLPHDGWDSAVVVDGEDGSVGLAVAAAARGGELGEACSVHLEALEALLGAHTRKD